MLPRILLIKLPLLKISDRLTRWVDFSNGYRDTVATRMDFITQLANASVTARTVDKTPDRQVSTRDSDDDDGTTTQRTTTTTTGWDRTTVTGGFTERTHNQLTTGSTYTNEEQLVRTDSNSVSVGFSSSSPDSKTENTANSTTDITRKPTDDHPPASG